MEAMIKKKALLDDLNRIKEVLVGQGDPILASVLNRAIACVENQPALDAVEVVRCKDCKHYARDEMFGGGYCYGARKKLDDFCSCGERKSNE